MNRRALLAVVGSSALAGCSSVPNPLGGGPHTGLGWLSVLNHATDPYDLTVEVRSGDELVLDRTYELEASTDDDVPYREVACAWRDTEGPYRLRGRHGESDGWTELDLSDDIGHEFPVGVEVHVGDAVREGDEVQFWVTADEQPDCRVGEERR